LSIRFNQNPSLLQFILSQSFLSISPSLDFSHSQFLKFRQRCANIKTLVACVLEVAEV
jgi:hypothetical protein